MQPGSYYFQTTLATTVSLAAGVVGQALTTDGAALDANFNNPRYMSLAPDGLSFAIGDENNNRVRILTRTEQSKPWSSGTVSTIGGNFVYSEGAGGEAGFGQVSGVKYSADGLSLFIADRGNAALRIVERDSAAIDFTTVITATIVGDGIGDRDGAVDECVSATNCPQFTDP